MSKETKLTFNLAEPKKHSGKYVQEGTENDTWPTMLYLKKEWFEGKQLPQTAIVTIVTKED
jgi:hypothetical protein